MKKTALCSVLSLCCLASVDTITRNDQRHKPHQHRHEQYAQRKNPVAMTAQSVAEGRKLFYKHCRVCHGESGKGGFGPDLTDDSWIHGNTDGEIFTVITSGVQGTSMRGFKKDLTEEMRWHLVNYLTSLRKTKKWVR